MRNCNAAIFRHAGVALDHAVLDLDRAAHRVDHAAKLDEAAVASALDDTPMMRTIAGSISSLRSAGAAPAFAHRQPRRAGCTRQHRRPGSRRAFGSRSWRASGCRYLSTKTRQNSRGLSRFGDSRFRRGPVTSVRGQKVRVPYTPRRSRSGVAPPVGSFAKKMLRSSLPRLSQPPSASARSISRQKSSSTQTTPSSPAASDAPKMRAPDHDRARAKRQRLDDVDASAKAAVDQDRDSAADRFDHSGQRADRRDRAVELSSSMVGDDDSVGASVDRLARLVRMQTGP